MGDATLESFRTGTTLPAAKLDVLQYLADTPVDFV